MSILSPLAPQIDVPADASLYELLTTRAKQMADTPSILAPGRTPLTFGGLLSHVEETIQALRGCGIGRHDRVAVVLPQGPEAATAVLAVSAGAISLPLNPAYRASELDSFFSRLNAQALLTQVDIDSPAKAVAEARGMRVVELSPLLDAEAGRFRLGGDESRGAAPLDFTTADDVAIILHTSGTTSLPKIVPLTQGNLLASAHQVVRIRLIDEHDCCLNLVPTFHVYALISLLAVVVAGGSIVFPTHFSATEFFDWMEAFRPTSYTAVPSMHQAILETAATLPTAPNSRSLRYIPSSGAPLPPQVRDQLEQLFGAPVIESYGMTEAGLITVNPVPPGKRPSGSVGLSAGAEIAVIDDAGARVPTGTDGEVIVRGPSVMQGYENDPSANEQAFIDGWLRTGDLGHLDDEGYLYITGRIKEMINRGGEKISPREVDEALLDHPAIAQAVTFAIPDANLGEDVAAAVVLRSGVSISEQQIRQSVARRLADFKVPQQVLFVEEIPKGPTGKVQRIGLAERLGVTSRAPDRSRAEVELTPARYPLEADLCEIWKQVLGLPEIGIHDDFFQIGGNSLQAADLMARIEKQHGRRLLLATLFQAPTVAQVAALLQLPETELPGASLVEIQPIGSRLPLFCVHPLGGNVLGYYDLARHLGADQPVYGLQARGLDGKQTPLARIEDMAATYLKEMRAIQPEGPYALCGQSFGGIVAYEMAQQLAAAGQEVALLALFDSYGPEILWHQSVARLARRILRHLQAARRLERRSGAEYMMARVRGVRKRIIRRTWQFRYKVHRRLRLDLPDNLRQIGMTNYLAIAQYVPRAYPGRLTLFPATEQSVAALDDPELGWQGMASEGVEVHPTPGSHITILQEPNVRVLAERLSSLLERSTAVRASR